MVDMTDNVTGLANEAHPFLCGGYAGVLDEWYCYTPSCTGEASVSICTDFAGSEITIGIFESCTPGLGDDLIACASSGGTANRSRRGQRPRDRRR